MAQCSFDGCLRDSDSKGLCTAHYQQLRLGKVLKPLQEQHHGLTEYARFMSWVKVGGPKECWEWQASRNLKGWHGQFRNALGGVELSHRASWRLMKGEIPKGLFVCHHCDNPICVNPNHLFLGSQSDNMKDMWAKGRARPKSNFGEKHGMSKLTAEIVKEIRSSSETGSALAKKFGIAATTVCDIKKRRTWNHIE